MTARVQVTVNPERAWSVPVSAALADDSGKAFVWKVDPGSKTVSRAPVAISGVNQLRDGMEIRLIEQ